MIIDLSSSEKDDKDFIKIEDVFLLEIIELKTI